MHKRSSFICTRILHSACSWKTALPAGRLRSIVRPIWFTCQLQRDAPGDQERSATSFLTGKVGNSLQQLVFSAFFSCCVCDPSQSLRWTFLALPRAPPYPGVPAEVFLTFLLSPQLFSWGIQAHHPCFQGFSYTNAQVPYIWLSLAANPKIVEQCFLKTCSITISRAGKQ